MELWFHLVTVHPEVIYSEILPRDIHFNVSIFLVQNFRKLLLHKCQEEFENRRKVNAAFDSRQDGLTAEEKEQKAIAKRKMLGNIKFVGERYYQC